MKWYIFIVKALKQEPENLNLQKKYSQEKEQDGENFNSQYSKGTKQFMLDFGWDLIEKWNWLAMSYEREK